jgi:adenylate cyclase class 2
VASDQELEVKFYISDIKALRMRLVEAGAREIQPRTYELNLRFDTPDGRMTRAHQVLRLRRDRQFRLTYKGPSVSQQGVRVRQEIEFSVGDFDAARAFLGALGYQVSMQYEKYRAEYELGDTHVTLDELPYGNFSEIEGPDPVAIQAVNARLGLDWSARVSESYAGLFSRLQDKLALDFRDLSFQNFKHLRITPAQLGLRPADE